MKKQHLLSLLLLLITSISFAQTDEFNLEKYWKFRNDFRQKFIKIGPDAGESMPMGRRGIGKCLDLTDDGVSESYGTLYWGDGVIRHGHYLGFLATEYALLKKNNQDLTAIKHELYYALQAINRLDRTAEPLITGKKDECLLLPESLNGFYLRDDVPKDFEDYWKDEKINANAVGGFYDTNNSDDHNYETDGPHPMFLTETNIIAEYPISKHTQHWMTPSLDQMTSLLVGLKVCHALLEDGIIVQPTLGDVAIDLRDEVEQITHRVVTFAADHNWFLIDMKGWPVGNGGGDLLIQAYAIKKTAEDITGMTYVSTAKRRAAGYINARSYDEAPTAADKAIVWDALSLVQKTAVSAILEQDVFYMDELLPGVSHLLNPSEFELWQSGPGSIELNVDGMAGNWMVMTPELWALYEADWNDNNKFDTEIGGLFGMIKFEDLNIFANYNKTIMFNLGVSSGIFTPAQTASWGTYTDNHQLVLIEAMLNDHLPATGDKASYQALLNSMPVSGSYKFSGWNGASAEQLFWSKDWAEEYRWTLGNGTIEGDQAKGQYSNLDYMYLHNLYSLIYESELPAYKEEYTCICDVNPLESIPYTMTVNTPVITPMSTEDLISGGQTIVFDMKKQFDFLEFCVQNAFKAFPTNELASELNLHQLFGDAYHDIDILLNKYQTEYLSIKSGGKLNIESRLVICENKILTIESGGEVNLNKGAIWVNPNAQLIIEGDLNAMEGTEIILKEGAKLLIRGGGTFFNEAYVQVNEGASVEYEENAELIMPTASSEIHFNGGDLLIKADATFEMNHAGYSASGQLRFSTWGEHVFGESNSRFQLKGKNELDPILIIEKDADFWTNNVLDFIKIDDGKIIFEENSRFVATTDFYSNGVKYVANAINRGVTLFHYNHIVNAEFNDVPIFAPLFYGPAGSLNLYNSVVNNDVSDQAVRVEGGKYTIGNTDFNTNQLVVIDSKNMTRSSRLYNSTLNATLENGPITIGVNDHSDVQVLMSNNVLNNNSIGAMKKEGDLHLSCNSFLNFTIAGVSGLSNSKIRMNSWSRTGYNAFLLNNNSALNVSLDAAREVVLNRGYNDFDVSGLPIIGGTLNPYFAYSLINGEANRWNLGFAPPAAGFSNLTNYVSGTPINIDPSNQSLAFCGANNPPGGGIVIANGQSSTGSSPQLQFTFGIVSIEDGIAMASNLMKEFNTTGSNAQALAMFSEMLTYNYQYQNNQLSLALDKCQEYAEQTLRHMIDEGEITVGSNSQNFDPSVQLYVNGLNARSSEIVNATNYGEQFDLEMAKAQLFHLIGNRDKAVEVLVNAENCGVLVDDQIRINYWKKVYQTEMAKISYGYEAEFLDTIWVDTTAYLTPNTQQQFGNFGSVIYSPNVIVSSGCSSNAKMFQSNDEVVELEVYPNPVSDNLNVRYNLDGKASGKFIIYSLQGQELYSIDLNRDQNSQSIDISMLSIGTYIYSYFIDEIKMKTGKLVVN